MKGPFEVSKATCKWAISNLKNNCSNKKPRKERHKGHKYFLNVRDGISLVVLQAYFEPRHETFRYE